MGIPRKGRILQNIGSSWSALAVNVVVGIFLSPIIVHRLGDTAFGIWVLIFSVTGYYGMFDLGIRTSIVRFVSKYVVTKEADKLASHVNTSLFTYSVMGLVAFAVTVFLTLYLDRLFRIPAALQPQARWLMLMAGCSVALGFPLGVFGGILDGMQRFDLTNWSGILSSLLRAVLVVLVLRRGYGLMMVTAITVIMPILTSILRGVLVFRLLRVPIALKYVNRESFRQMAHFSAMTTIAIIAAQLRFRTDELVIGSMISAAAVTYFSIGVRPVDYAQQLVASMAQIFVPMSSELEAGGQMDRVRKVYLAGNRACALTVFPITAVIVILGKSIIEVWMGAKYVAISYPVTVIIAIPVTLFVMQAASGRILIGMGRHAQYAQVVFAEGIANLVLSILLVPPLGIVGDALGTAIPMFLTTLWFLPRHMRKQLEVPITVFLREAYTLPFVLLLPVVAVLLLLQNWFYPHHLWQLVLQVTAAGIVYGIGLLWAYKTGRILKISESATARPVLGEEVAAASALRDRFGEEA